MRPRSWSNSVRPSEDLKVRKLWQGNTKILRRRRDARQVVSMLIPDSIISSVVLTQLVLVKVILKVIEDITFLSGGRSVRMVVWHALVTSTSDPRK